MVQYTGYIISHINSTARNNIRPGIMLAATPTDKQIRQIQAYKAEINMTAATNNLANSKQGKTAMILSAMPTSIQSGTTVIVTGVKTPRTTPLEINWTKANKK